MYDVLLICQTNNPRAPATPFSSSREPGKRDRVEDGAGKGKGKGKGAGKAREPEWKKTKTEGSFGGDASAKKCFRCKRFGHVIADCPQRGH
jgi:hypothetical protein